MTHTFTARPIGNTDVGILTSLGNWLKPPLQRLALRLARYLTIWACVHLVFLFLIHSVSAAGLTFTPKFPERQIVLPSFKTAKKQPTDYKAARAQEIAEMSREYGLYEHRNLLIAHLLRECGSMTEYCNWRPGMKNNDHGWAFGIAQWHLYYRERDWLKKNGFHYPGSNIAKVREKFFQDFPDMKDWRGQARRYLREIKSCMDGFRTVEFCIDSWNANPAYMSQVKAQLANARSLLSL